MNKHTFALSCALGAMAACISHPALAQAASGEPQGTPVAAAAGADSSASQGALEDIIVTAQKVKTDAQKTPIAIQLVRGEAITTQGVDNAKDLNRLVSSLAAQPSQGAGTSFYIRGVGSNNGNANTDNGVAVNLDQMYFARAFGPDLAFYDIDRIEVLKGPQGTLYGRNATGGVINILSTKPELGKLSGYGRAEFGNYREIRVNAAINVPLSDTLAVRAAFQANQHDGYLTDGYDDNRQRGGRIHLLWKPGNRFSLLLTGEYDHAGGKGSEAVGQVANKLLFSNPYTGGGSPEGVAFFKTFPNLGTPVPGRYTVAPGSCYPGCLPAGFTSADASPSGQPYRVTNNGFIDVTVKSVRADLEWNVGFGTLSVVPAYLKTDYSTIFYNGPSPFYNNGSAEQESLEVRLASAQDKRLTWLLGFFGQREQQSFAFIGAFGFPFAYQGTFQPDVRDHAYGVFAQSSFKIVPTLTLTAGVRYSSEHKENFNARADNATLVPPLARFVTAPENRERSSSPTFRVGLDWLPTPHNLLYASFATGFHSGGLQQGQPPVRPLCVPVINGTTAQFIASVTGCDAPGTFLPEHLDAYTVGSKNRFLDNKLQLNLEAYDWEYTNLQVGTLGLSNPGQTGQVVQNAGSARVRGLDVDVLARVTEHDEVGVSANYNDSKYGHLLFFNYVVNSPFPPQINDFSGRHFINAPDFTFTSHYQHTFDFGHGSTLTPLISAQYSSMVSYNVSPVQSQASYYKLDLALTYRSPNDRFELQLFARNVNDAVTINGSGGNDSVTNLAFVHLAPPRTFGGSVRVNF